MPAEEKSGERSNVRASRMPLERKKLPSGYVRASCIPASGKIIAER